MPAAQRILEDHVRTTRSLVRYLLDQLVTVHQQMLLEREAAQHRADMAQKREDDRRREADEMRRKSEEDRLAVGRLREELAELRRELAARHAESAAAAAREAEQARAQIALVKGQVDHAGAQLGRGIQALSARIDGGDRQLRQVVAAQNAGAEQAAGALKAVLAEAIAAARKEGEDGQAPLRPLITRALDEARSEHLCAVADLEKRCAAAVKANDARCDAAAEACRTLEARVAAISSAQAGLSERLEITSAKNEKTAEDILAAIGSTKEALQLVRSEAALKRSALKGEMRAELASLRETSDSLLDELRGDVRRLQRPIVVV